MHMDSALPCTPAADYRTGATRVDGWTAERQILFLETLADSALVSEAAGAAGMSAAAAYALRRRPEGLAFALGWKAALLLARDPLADQLREAAAKGVETVTTREEGVTRRRSFHNGLATSVLNRLDRQASAADDEAATARAIASAFAGFMDLIASGGDRSDVADFLERHPDPLEVARARRLAREAAHDIAAARDVAVAGVGRGVTGSVTAGGRPEAAQAALMRKLVEESALFRVEDGASEVSFTSTRAKRRAMRAKAKFATSRV